MTSPNPRVSVIVPSYKRPLFLGRAIESVLAQTFQDWDLTIVDDNGEGSPEQDETQRLVERYANDPRITYLTHAENRGGSAARNTGILHTTGELVAFLDDDDEWLPEKLERQVACFDRADADVCLVYTGKRVLVEEDGHAFLEPPLLRGDVFPRLLAHNDVGTTSAIVCRRRALIDVGMFDETLEASQDYDLYLRLAQRCSFDFVDAPLVVRHVHLGMRITTGLEAKIRASEAIYRKYADAFARLPRARSDYLFTHGRLQIEAGDRTRAAATFLRSYRADPRKLSRVGYALAAWAGPSAYEAAREVTRPLRMMFRAPPGRGVDAGDPNGGSGRRR